MSDPAGAARRLIIAIILLIGVVSWQTAGAQRGATFDTFASQVAPGDLVPGADRFGPTGESPPVAQVFRGDQLVGYAYLNSQYVNADGYSSKPIHVMVGLDTTGTIVGLVLAHHEEPIVLVGISEERVVDYLDGLIGYNPLRAAATGEGPPTVDLVSGATVTVLVMGESVTRPGWPGCWAWMAAARPPPLPRRQGPAPRRRAPWIPTRAGSAAGRNCGTKALSPTSD